MMGVWIFAGSAAGGTGVWLLRSALDGDRRKLAAGWSALALLLTLFVLAIGGERGAPTAIVTFSALGLIGVALSAARRPWRTKTRAADDEALSPARREGWLRATSRWLAAGPLALIAAAGLVAAGAATLGARSNDGVVLSLAAIMIVWPALGAWAFSTRAPLRTTGVIAALALCGTGAIALDAFA